MVATTKTRLKALFQSFYLVEEGYNREAHKPYVDIFLRMEVTSFSGGPRQTAWVLTCQSHKST